MHSMHAELLLLTRVAPDLIFFQIQPGPDLAGFGIADPAGVGAVLELEA